MDVHYSLRFSITAYPGLQDRHPGLALGLQRRLDGVDWGEDHTERSRGRGRKHGFEPRGKLLHIGIGVEQREDAGVGGCVAEAGHGALHECGGEALVVSCPATVRVKRARSLCGSRSVAVLVIHYRSEGLGYTISQFR